MSRRGGGFLGFGHGLAHVERLVHQAQQRQRRAFSGRRGVVGRPGGGHQRVQQHALAAGLARPHRTQARPAFGRRGPAQFRRVLDQQVGTRRLQLLPDQLAVRLLEGVGRGLGLVEQAVGGLAGPRLALT